MLHILDITKNLEMLQELQSGNQQYDSLREIQKCAHVW